MKVGETIHSDLGPENEEKKGKNKKVRFRLTARDAKEGGRWKRNTEIQEIIYISGNENGTKDRCLRTPQPSIVKSLEEAGISKILEKPRGGKRKCGRGRQFKATGLDRN
ncbi:hypothetical protein TSAR_007557 [Trichomalopsis sarcophagae]|uniref:Uncharacterized protein n=1 Tax=Trichomalopsis sarcophagae TaxID=543379 RepID=A0A232FDW2_9HYME|nr:hypothetical protein TSAR_007557 [Trichomalopsis sarcophagae]